MITLLLLACHPRLCDDHGDCPSDEICVVGACEPALDRDWDVEIVAAEAGEVHPDGLDWDGDRSPPDLYAEFGVANGDGCVTSWRPNEHEPVWAESCRFYVYEDATLLVNLWDYDLGEDDFVAGWYWEGDLELVPLFRTYGKDIAFVDESGTVVVWIRLDPS